MSYCNRLSEAGGTLCRPGRRQPCDLIRDGVTRLTEDHSLVQELVKNGGMRGASSTTPAQCSDQSTGIELSLNDLPVQVVSKLNKS